MILRAMRLDRQAQVARARQEAAVLPLMDRALALLGQVGAQFQPVVLQRLQLNRARWAGGIAAVAGARDCRAWATAQGLVTLPMAALAFLVLAVADGAGLPLLPAGFDFPAGPRLWPYVGLMMAVGLFASWLGTLCWNEASQRLPTTLVGQLIVFETLAALVYAQVHRGAWPPPMGVAGVVLLVGGVCWALRLKPVPPARERHLPASSA